VGYVGREVGIGTVVVGDGGAGVGGVEGDGCGVCGVGSGVESEGESGEPKLMHMHYIPKLAHAHEDLDGREYPISKTVKQHLMVWALQNGY